MNIETINELIASLESAGELSIREREYLELAKAYQQLAAENVGLKAAAEFATAPDMWIEQADGMLDYRYCDWYVDVLKAAMETPATDRIYAGIKADGVEEFAAYCGEENSVFVEAKGYYRSLPNAAYEFCVMLREGAE
ncbi:hypothetical protein [Raoultella lignicola]|uniref:Phage protein n=1 Tax=Raoultella lignicola TaxID=3040939 RepID=A0ABU9F6Y2_9ENTR